MSLLLFIESLGLRWSSYIAVGLFLLIMLKQGFHKTKFVFDNGVAWIALFSVTYVFICFAQGSSRLEFVVHPILYYIIGNWLIRFSNQKEKDLFEYIWMITLGMFVHVLLTFIHNGYDVNRYEIVDVWTGKIWNATGIASCLIFSCSLLIYAFKGKCCKLKKACLIIQTLFSVFLGLWCGSRTLLVVTAIVMVFIILKTAQNNVGKIIKWLALIGFLVAISLVLYYTNTGGIADKINELSLFQRYEAEDLNASDARRYAAFGEGLKGLIDYPFGGNSEFSYAHNLWLDVARQAGIIPMLFLIGFFVCVGKKIFRYTRRNSKDLAFSYVVVAVFLGFTLDCMVEPIMNGMEQQFLLFVMVMGMVYAYTDGQNALHGERMNHRGRYRKYYSSRV